MKIALTLPGLLLACWALAGATPAAVEPQTQKVRFDRAKIDVKNLEKAVQVFKIKNGVYPESLQVLGQVQADGGLPYVEKALLLDPWERPYQYEPNVVSPNTGVPLIFSQGPDPKDKKGYIRNWGTFVGADDAEKAIKDYIKAMT